MTEYNFKEEADRRSFYNSKEWRGKDGIKHRVLERDAWECVWCKEQGLVTTRAKEVLEVDHIYEVEHYPQLALHIDNLRTLCKTCHNKRHDRFGYKKKKPRFTNIERW